MKYYCGIDVSLNNTAICIVNRDGDIIREGEVPTEPDAIALWLSDLGLHLERIGLEAGTLTPWLCHELLGMGLPAICIETRHVKAALKAQQVKTDRNDARGIAHIMRTGWFREVHVKSHESQKLRVLLNNRRCLLDKGNRQALKVGELGEDELRDVGDAATLGRYDWPEDDDDAEPQKPE